MDQEEISEKIRKAIKAKLTELGSYIDDELPDYIMVMIANKKPVDQMTSDLDLFLGDNADPFTQWLENLLNRLQSVAKSVVKAEPKTSLGPADSQPKRIKGESQQGSEVDSPAPAEDDVREEPLDTEEREKTADAQATATAAATVLTLHAQEDDEVEFEDDDDDDEPVVQPKTIPKQTTVKSKSAGSVTKATPTSKPASKSPSKVRAVPGVKAERAAATRSDVPSDLLAARKRMISTRGDSEMLIPRAAVQPSRRAIQPPSPGELSPDRDSPPVRDRRGSRSPAGRRESPRRRYSPERGRGRSRSPPPRRAPLNTRLGRGGSPASRDRLNNRLRELAGGRRGDYRPRDMDSRRDDYRRDRDRDRPAYRDRTRNRSYERDNFRASNRRPVWQEAVDDREKRARSPAPSGGIVSQIGTAVPRVEILSDDSDDDQQVGGVASVLKVPDRKSSVPENLQANKNLLMKAMAAVNKSVPAPSHDVITVEDDSSGPDRREKRTSKARVSAKQRIGGISSRSSRGQARDLAERLDRRSPDHKRRKSRSPSSRSRSRSPLEYDEEDLLEVLTLLQKRRRQRRSDETQARQESATARPDNTQTTARRADVKLRLGHRGLHKARPEAEEWSGEEEGGDRSQSEDIDLAQGESSGGGGGASPKFVVTLDAVTDMSKLLPHAKNLDDTDDIELLDNPMADVNQAASDRTEDDISLDLNVVSGTGNADNLSTILCRFLPNCKAGALCPFSHPICKNYPNCRFGSSCVYKHPHKPITASTPTAAISINASLTSSIMCRYDGVCTKPNCQYKHSHPKKLVNPGAVLSHLKLNSPSVVKPPSKTVCRFHPKCTNMDCLYLHPKPCKFGVSCLRRTTGCIFTHPSLPTKTQLKWTKSASSETAVGGHMTDVST